MGRRSAGLGASNFDSLRRDDAPSDDEELSIWLRTLENVFVEIRDRGVQWSEADITHATAWFREGLSLPTVIRAIDRQAKALRYVRGKDSLPHHLAFYDPAVRRETSRDPNRRTARQPHERSSDKAAQDYAELPPVTLLLLSLIDSVPELVSSADDPALAEAYRRAGRSLGRSLMGEGRGGHANSNGEESALDPPTEFSPDLEAALSAAEDILTRTLLKGVGATRAAELTSKLDQRGPRRGSKRAQKARRRTLLAQTLAREFGLRLPSAEGWISPMTDVRGNER